MKVLALLLLATSSMTSGALAWGSMGHAVVAEIADRRLQTKAIEGVAALLGPNVSLASIASWADDFKFAPGGERTKAWHYIDLDVTSSDSNWNKECGASLEGDCLPFALKREIAVLKDAKVGNQARIAALKFVVHLIGDSTQPLHCTERNGDGGGNGLVVMFEGNDPSGRPIVNPDKSPKREQMSFHELWDTALVETRAYSFGSYVDQLEAAIIPQIAGQPAAPSDTDIDAWVKECHKAGVLMYQALPNSAVPVINAKYQQAAHGIIDVQLATAGLRLAAILNDVWKTPVTP